MFPHQCISAILIYDTILYSDGWSSKPEFKAWLTRASADFEFATSNNLSDTELIQLAADAQTTPCQCDACQSVYQFVVDPTVFVRLVPCSRIGRHHIHQRLAEEEHVVGERYMEGTGMLVKKLQSHPHATMLTTEDYHTAVGHQG